MRIAIIDDEPLARLRLRGLIQDLGIAAELVEATNGIEGIALVEADAPDIILLDIRMPGMDGIEMARHVCKLETPPAIVFTTAYDQHALAAFETHAVDYLLKPIRQERLCRALERARIITEAQAKLLSHEPQQSAPRSHLSALVQGNLRVIAVKQIYVFHADQGYVNAIWPGGELLLEEPLKDLETEFGERFLRVHRNALVAVEHISGMEKDKAGGRVVTVQDLDIRIDVSRRNLSQVRKRLRHSH